MGAGLRGGDTCAPGFWNMEVSRAAFIPLEVHGHMLCARRAISVLAGGTTIQLTIGGV